LNTALKQEKTPQAGMPEGVKDKDIDTISLSNHLPIVNALDHMLALHRDTHPQGLVHVEIAGDERDYPRMDRARLADWKRAHTFNGQKDVYIAINPLYDWKAKRTNDNVSDIQWVWVDVDCNSDAPDWAFVTSLKVQRLIDKGLLPEPSLTVFSGRGLWYMWRIQPISPRHKTHLKRWRDLIGQFGDVLRPYGADRASVDPARLMRLAGTVNSKSGRLVTIQQGIQESYDLDDLAERFLPAKKKAAPKPKRVRKATTTGQVKRLHNLYSLNKARCQDLENLVALRGGDLTGYRNNLLFIYALYRLHTDKDITLTARYVEDLNDSLTDPLPPSEVVKTIRSAEEAHTKGEEKDDPYTFKNETIIDWLAITPEEQAHMSTILGAEEKKGRHRERMRKARGGVSKAEHEAKILKDKLDKLNALRIAIQDHPDLSNRALAQVLGWSEGTVRNLKKKLAE